MITGKYSAVKGFGLFFYAVITILVMVCCINAGNNWGIIGFINAIINGTVIVLTYSTWSKTDKDNETRQ